MKPITQQDFETVIVPLIQKLQARSEPVVFAELLRSCDFDPQHIEHINFSVEGVTVKTSGINGKKDQETYPSETKVVHATDLLEHIDYSGCVFNQCQFDSCSMSHSKILGSKFLNCSMQLTTIENSQLEYCSFESTDLLQKSPMQTLCLSFSDMNRVRFENVDLSYAAFDQMKSLKQVSFHDTELSGAHFLGKYKPEHCQINASNERTLDNLYIFEKNFDIDRKITLTQSREPIWLSWNYKTPGIAASLVRKSLMHSGAMPILVEYLPPFKNSKEQAELDTEVEKAAKKAKRNMDQLNVRKKELMVRLSSCTNPSARRQLQVELAQINSINEHKGLPLWIIESVKEDPREYPLMNTLIEYTNDCAANVSGILIPGGDDIHPIFYGQDVASTAAPLKDRRRDIIDFALIDRQEKTTQPLFAICRGSQILALSYGAKFYQEVGDEQVFINDPVEMMGGSGSTPSKPSYSLSQITENGYFWVRHQGFELSPDNKALLEIISIDSRKRLTAALESCARNIFSIQYHAEFGMEKEFVTNLKLNPEVGGSFLSGFVTRCEAYRKQQSSVSLVEAMIEQESSKSQASRSGFFKGPSASSLRCNHNVVTDVAIAGLDIQSLQQALESLNQHKKIVVFTDEDIHATVNHSEKIIEFGDEDMQQLRQLVTHTELLLELVRERRIATGTSDRSDKNTTYSISELDLKEVLLAELKLRLAETDKWPEFHVYKVRDLKDIGLQESGIHLSNIEFEFTATDRKLIQLDRSGLMECYRDRIQKLSRMLVELSDDAVVQGEDLEAKRVLLKQRIEMLHSMCDLLSHVTVNCRDTKFQPVSALEVY